MSVMDVGILKATTRRRASAVLCAVIGQCQIEPNIIADWTTCDLGTYYVVSNSTRLSTLAREPLFYQL